MEDHCNLQQTHAPWYYTKYFMHRVSSHVVFLIMRDQAPIRRQKRDESYIENIIMITKFVLYTFKIICNEGVESTAVSIETLSYR